MKKSTCQFFGQANNHSISFDKKSALYKFWSYKVDETICVAPNLITTYCYIIIRCKESSRTSIISFWGHFQIQVGRSKKIRSTLSMNLYWMHSATFSGSYKIWIKKLFKYVLYLKKSKIKIRKIIEKSLAAEVENCRDDPSQSC